MKDERVCPSCGKPALPVATRCPKCGYGFETRYDRPYTDTPRRTGLFGGLLLLVIIAMILANALRRHGGGRTAEPPNEAGMPAPAATPISDSHRQPVVTSRPAPVARTAPTAPVPLATARPIQPAPAALPSGTHRYATTWINLRSARSTRAPIVKVLRPGEIVRIDSLGQGWYQVVTADRIQGYADRRLLSEAPPAKVP